MKQFLKQNSQAIRKFLLTHTVTSLLGIMVGLAIIGFEGEDDTTGVLSIIASVFTIGFMCFLHYDDMYFIGAKNAISAKGEGVELDKFRGLKITLLAFSPVVLIGIITIILDLAVNTGNDEATVSFLMIYYAVQGAFLSLWKLRLAVGVAGYVVITLFPPVIASVLGYIIGSKQKTLRGLLGFKVKPPYDGPIPEKKSRWFK